MGCGTGKKKESVYVQSEIDDSRNCWEEGKDNGERRDMEEIVKRIVYVFLEDLYREVKRKRWV